MGFDIDRGMREHRLTTRIRPIPPPPAPQPRKSHHRSTSEGSLAKKKSTGGTGGMLESVLGIYPAEQKLPPGRSAADEMVDRITRRFSKRRNSVILKPQISAPTLSDRKRKELPTPPSSRASVEPIPPPLVAELPCHSSPLPPPSPAWTPSGRNRIKPLPNAHIYATMPLPPLPLAPKFPTIHILNDDAAVSAYAQDITNWAECLYPRSGPPTPEILVTPAEEDGKKYKLFINRKDMLLPFAPEKMSNGFMSAEEEKWRLARLMEEEKEDRGANEDEPEELRTPKTKCEEQVLDAKRLSLLEDKEDDEYEFLSDSGYGDIDDLPESLDYLDDIQDSDIEAILASSKRNSGGFGLGFYECRKGKELMS